MKLPVLLPLFALLCACGSNVPPSPEAERKAREAMRGMTMPTPTGNQDRDFARSMIAHHQGAIDMARSQLARGTDPAMRQLAGKIIADQQREIGELNAFLDRTGGR